MRFGRAVARPGGVGNSDGTAGTARRASGGAAPPEQRVEEGVGGLGQDDHAQGHRLQEMDEVRCK